MPYPKLMISNNNADNFKHSDFSNPKFHNVLHRERLINLLKEHSTRKLFLIHAKAGQGKSIIASDFIRKINKKSKWINLTKDDSDPLKLLDKLDAAVNVLQCLRTGNSTGW